MSALPPFVPGLDLCERFYVEAVRPLFDSRFPGIAHAAARLGSGSEVVGFDTAQSRDHHWGLRVTLFLTEDDLREHANAILRVMANGLPFDVAGYPTHFATPELNGGRPEFTAERPIAHGVEVTTVARFTLEYLGRDATQPIAQPEWLTIPSQRLRTVRAGRVFHDGLGELTKARERFRWYPRDVWLYLMANQWRRIDQEEPFVGRCGDVGDDLGSRIIAARQIRELMRLALLVEGEYAPYSKWFGTSFAKLRCAASLLPIFDEAMATHDWRVRERRLGDATLRIGEMHNQLGVTKPIALRLAPFWGRPYLVAHSGRFAEAIHASIAAEEIRMLPPNVGSVDQFVDSTDVQDSVERMKALAVLYRLDSAARVRVLD
jgi:hypothetical protein